MKMQQPQLIRCGRCKKIVDVEDTCKVVAEQYKDNIYQKHTVLDLCDSCVKEVKENKEVIE